MINRLNHLPRYVHRFRWLHSMSSPSVVTRNTERGFNVNASKTLRGRGGTEGGEGRRGETKGRRGEEENGTNISTHDCRHNTPTPTPTPLFHTLTLPHITHTLPHITHTLLVSSPAATRAFSTSDSAVVAQEEIRWRRRKRCSPSVPISPP